MRELQSFECFAVGGAGTEKLTLDSILSMLESGETMQYIAKLGLKSATELKQPDWGNNVAGDAGYTLSATGSRIRWFFSGDGYFFQ